MLTRLRFLTAGESHGPGLVGILEGLPAGIPVSVALIAEDLRRRREAPGRSPRQNIESDDVEIMGGVRDDVTMGSPVALVLRNRDHRATLASGTVPRPGHADLAGAKKLDIDDVRRIAERASARETAMRTALGAIARSLLREINVEVNSEVISVGCTRENMLSAIDDARARGDTLGGVLEVRASGLPIGLGHFAHPDRRLNARLSEAVSSIHAIKAVGIGDAWDSASSTGRAFHDPIVDVGGARASNRGGGIEGGMTNGMPLVVRAAMKPLPTVTGGLPSIDLATGEPAPGLVERSDTSAVHAAAVVAESMVCLVLADALLEKFGGDTVAQLKLHMGLTSRTVRA